MHGFIFFSFIFSLLGKPIFNKKESINKDDNKTMRRVFSGTLLTLFLIKIVCDKDK